MKTEKKIYIYIGGVVSAANRHEVIRGTQLLIDNGENLK